MDKIPKHVSLHSNKSEPTTNICDFALTRYSRRLCIESSDATLLLDLDVDQNFISIHFKHDI